jgi:pilus assembly protein CpaE
VGRVLEAKGHAASLFEGGKSRMREIAEREQPDLMLVDGMCCDTAELAQVEYVTTHHPSVAVILLCSTHTPEFLINSMRAGVREVLPSPVTPPALEAAVARVAAKLIGLPARKTGKILAFMPCKGGAGATFLATNLGWQLAETKSVLLIDLNLQFGDALSFVHDGKAPSTLADVAKDISRLDASLLAASTVKVAPNYSILAAPEDLAHAMEVKPEHIDAILSLAVTQYDFVLLDVPRLLDTMAIKALDRAWRIFPVLQSGLPDLRNAGKLLEAFKATAPPTAGERVSAAALSGERG